MASTIRLSLLGTLGIDGGERPRAVLRQPKRASLLIYLAVGRPGVAVRRDSLLAMFWPELDGAHARDALNSALLYLRKQLGAQVLLSHTGDQVGVDPVVIRTDVAEFEEAVSAGRVDEALALYRGPLLDGFHADAPGFEEWLATERARLHDLAIRAARRASVRAAESGEAIAALTAARQWTLLAPDDERAALQVMHVLHAMGTPGAALRQWDAYTARLERDFAARPSSGALAAVDQIRRGGTPVLHLRTTGGVPVRPRSDGPTGESVPQTG